MDGLVTANAPPRARDDDGRLGDDPARASDYPATSGRARLPRARRAATAVLVFGVFLSETRACCLPDVTVIDGARYYYY